MIVILNRNFLRRVLLAACGLAFATIVRAGEPDAAGLELFEKRVRPLLVERCEECHSGEEPESGLGVDSLAALLRGGTRGPAIVPGKPNESLLIRAVQHGELLKMPPKSKLPAAEIADLARWVELGAPWPGAAPVTVTPQAPANIEPPIEEVQREFWSFQTPVRPPVPNVNDGAWVRSPIDAFVLSRLEKANMSPAPQADKRTLIRRVTFDLIGLPPTPEEVAAFVADESPDSLERLVDRLLASPHYGERWGRRWLDVARYADSNGLDENLAYANAFHYRDYVVAAFNADMPYDEFVREQIAGDLLPHDDPEQLFGQLAATGFLSLGGKMLAEDDPVKMQMDIIDEQIDTAGRAFMGLTLGCARCHHHKFDPVSTQDYYALAGIFKSTRTMENFNVVARWQERPLATPEQVALLQEQQARVAAKQAEIDACIRTANETLLTAARRHVGDYLLAAERQRRLETAVAQAHVIGNDDVLRTQPGVIVIEAENYDRGNVLKDITNYGASIGVLINRGETPNFTEYDVTIPARGTYQLELRYAAAASRPCRVSINGELAKADAAAKVTGSWNPDSQTWFVEGFCTLAAGKNVVRLEQPNAFPHIDKLLLAPASQSLGADDTTPLDPDYRPIPDWVQQWRDALTKADAGESPLKIWALFVRDGSEAAKSLRESSPLAARLLADPSPASASELASRFAEECRRVADEWDASQAAETKPTSLAEPADEALRQLLYSADGPFAVPKSIEANYDPEAKTRLENLRTEKTAHEAAVPKFPETMAVSDQTPEDVRVHIRGNHLTQAALVPRRFPRIFQPNDPPIAPDHSGRLEFAKWLTDSRHPLTARVLVNRVWQGHVGAGLVRSMDNFGMLGEPPTHPELLDWLAVEFMESGWSIKDLHRRIILSSTYQMSTTADPHALEMDPENRLLWRMNRRRLEAEAIRDALLTCGGGVDTTMRGSLLPTENRKYVTSTASVDPVVYNTRRRSVYLPVVRSALYDVFQAFDFADPSTSSGERQSTTVAPQALFMLNSGFVAEQARQMAERLIADSPDEPAARVEAAYQLAYSRPASVAEVERALAYVAAYASQSRADKSASESAEQADLHAWQSFCRAVLAANEFVYVE